MCRQNAGRILVIGLLGIATSASGARAPRDFFPLTSNDVKKVLVGKLINYDPPGTADMRIHEEFHPDGRWRVMLYGRGPIPSSGKWSINGDQICIEADSATEAARWHSARYCRAVWQNPKTGELRMEYLRDGPASPKKIGLQTVVVHDLPNLE